MKPRDIFKAQIEHKGTGTVPYTVNFDGEIDLQLDDYYGSTAWRDTIQTFHKVANVVNNRKRSPIDTPGLQKDVWGTIWRHDRRPEHLEQPGMLEPSFTRNNCASGSATSTSSSQTWGGAFLRAAGVCAGSKTS